MTIVVPVVPKILNLVCWLAWICFCTGMLFKASSVVNALMKTPIIWFFNREGEQADLLQELDLHVLNQAAQVCHRNELLAFVLTSRSPNVLDTATTLTQERVLTTVMAPKNSPESSIAGSLEPSLPTCVINIWCFPVEEEMTIKIRKSPFNDPSIFFWLK